MPCVINVVLIEKPFHGSINLGARVVLYRPL